MIVPVDDKNLKDAAAVYSKSWAHSHKKICSPEFIKEHTVEFQTAFLKAKLNSGWEIHIEYSDGVPVGIVGIYRKTGEIAMLYVSPDYHHMGFGKALLDFAVKEIKEDMQPYLLVLSANTKAIEVYERYGFIFSEKTTFALDKNVGAFIYVYSC